MAGKQKQQASEIDLNKLGQVQISAARLFEPAHKAVLTEAVTDHSGRIRGRANADVAQALSGDMGATRLVGGDTRVAGTVAGLAGEAKGAALREGSRRALELRDDITMEGANARLANSQASGNSLKRAARSDFAEAESKASTAQAYLNDGIDAATTLASAYVFNRMNKPGQDNSHLAGAASSAPRANLAAPGYTNPNYTRVNPYTVNLNGRG